MAAANYFATVQKIYIAFYQRPADPAGLQYWAQRIDLAGGDTSAVVAAFATSDEATKLYGTIDKTTVGDVVDKIYLALFGAAPDAAGKKFYVDNFTNGTFSAGTIALRVLDGATGGDAIAINNKAQVANDFTQQIDGRALNNAYFGTGTTFNATYSGETDVINARAILKAVTSSLATVLSPAQVTEKIKTLIADATDPIIGQSGGQTFTLTTGSDNFAGTAGNDTFNGLAGATAAAATDTLSASDIINGGAGTDTLNITTTATNANVLMGAQVSGVEVVNIRSTAGTATLDASNIAGLTAVNANAGVGAVTVSNLATGAAVGVTGNGTVVNGVTTFGYKTATDAATINISGGTASAGADTVDITNTSATTTAVTINSTGAANVVDVVTASTGATVAALTVNAATNLTVTALTGAFTATSALTVSGAAASVNLGAGATANFKTIDASGLTAGGLTIAGGSNLTSFKGGQGNDVFTTAATYGATTAGLVAAGAGTDTLVLNATTDMDSAAEAALYTGFDTLRTAGSQDMSLLAGVTAVQVGATTGVLSQMNAAQAAAVQVRVAATTATFALADSSGAADVLNLSMGTGTTTAAATGFTGAVTVNGFETLNITTNAGPTATAGANQTSVFGTAFVADKLTSIVLKGQSVTLTDAATTKAVTIDASALTGNGTTGLTLGGSLVAGSTVTGSAIADAITLGTVGSTYNLGAGNDAISGTLAQYRTATTYNTIDGGAGTDTANITGGAALTMVDDDFKGLTNVEKITVASTTVNDQSITTGGWFDAGFKAAGVTLTTTTTTGAVAIAAGSFTGNLTVSATTGTVTGSNTITTGSGNDTVTLVNTSVTGANTISTGAGNDTIVGSAAVETITGGTGADTMTGSGGADIFAFGTNGSIAGTSMDIITDFNAAGADVLTFGANTNLTYGADVTALVAGSNVNTTVGGLVTFATADNTLALKLVAIQADVQLDAVNSVAFFVDGANTYVYYAGAAIGNADDQIIQLTGINTLATITAGATTTIA